MMTSRAALELWILAVDHRAGRLLRGSWSAAGRVHIEERGAIANTPADREHGRPSPKRGKDAHSHTS